MRLCRVGNVSGATFLGTGDATSCDGTGDCAENRIYKMSQVSRYWPRVKGWYHQEDVNDASAGKEKAEAQKEMAGQHQG